MQFLLHIKAFRTIPVCIIIPINSNYICSNT
nr:MAG TPA: hypothetical protein [Caudoviricetes sp.]